MLLLCCAAIGLGDGGDLQLRERLSMTLPLLVVLPATHLEDTHLRMFALHRHGGLDDRTGDERRPDLQIDSISDGEHVENNLLSDLRSNLFDFDFLARGNLVLLSASTNYRVHVHPSFSNRCLTRNWSVYIPTYDDMINGTSPTDGVLETSASSHAALTAETLMSSDMEEVDAIIRERLASDVTLINQIARYIISAGGKRIRPRLVLLFANALDFAGRERFELAATVEFIHTATLLHDDVVDESSLRRGRETANALFGNAASVLVGDFLYSRAFQMMVSVNRMRVLAVLADATNVIAEGEVLQLMNMHNPDLMVEDYLRVIRFKTAKLFEASARLGAVLADAANALEETCAGYGRALGTAFQIVDDLLDYEGDSTRLGKNVGDDLREGKPTLPLLVAMQRGTVAERELIRQSIKRGEIANLDAILQIVRRTGALEITRDAARHEGERARQCLASLPASAYRDALLELCVRSVDRSS